MFKLFVLGALAGEIAAGRVSWDQELTVTAAVSPAQRDTAGRSGGTRLPVRQAALKVISVSDSTAADLLIRLLGRPAVEAQARHWSGHAALNVPFLTTRELFMLKCWPELAGQYLRLAPGQRAAFLATSVDPLQVSPAQLDNLALRGSPADIDTLEWFASPDDLCRAFAGLQQLAAQPALAPLGSILSANDGGLGLDPAQWPTVWYKGGSEQGVLTLAIWPPTARARPSWSSRCSATRRGTAPVGHGRIAGYCPGRLPPRPVTPPAPGPGTQARNCSMTALGVVSGSGR